MALTETFLKTYPIGTKIDYDGSYGCQCFDVINAYIQLITGKNPNMHLLQASDIYKRPEGIIPAGVNYQKLANTKEFVPQNGDIIVWENAGWNMWYGHTAICLSSDLNNGTVIQQNGLNIYEGTTLTAWNWRTHNFLGVIRLVVDKPETSQPTTETIYTVASGDSLWKIAKNHYKLTNNSDIKQKVDEIAKLNNITNLGVIHINQKIKLP